MRIIFHHPLPLDPERPVASALRPVKMLQAFRDAGCMVDVVAGCAAERKAASSAVAQELSKGRRYDFMYSESSTLPTLLTEPSRLPTNPSIDFGLMQQCRRVGVPVALFYRDMYWMFPQFKEKYGRVERWLIEQFYRYDLRKYATFVDKLYVPSAEMGRLVPTVEQRKVSALPPGHDLCVVQSRSRGRNGLRLLYVGGTGVHYDMAELFKAVDGLDDVSLTICTREAEWLSYRESTPGALPSNATVVHASGVALEDLYKETDIALVYVAPGNYWSFAAPYKLYEYLGKGKPIIASEGTLSAKFVEASGVGWSVSYGAASLRSLLELLLHSPADVAQKAAAVASVATEHTWGARVATVIADMTELRQVQVGNGIR